MHFDEMSIWTTKRWLNVYIIKIDYALKWRISIQIEQIKKVEIRIHVCNESTRKNQFRIIEWYFSRISIGKLNINSFAQCYFSAIENWKLDKQRASSMNFKFKRVTMTTIEIFFHYRITLTMPSTTSWNRCSSKKKNPKSPCEKMVNGITCKWYLIWIIYTLENKLLTMS